MSRNIVRRSSILLSIALITATAPASASLGGLGGALLGSMAPSLVNTGVKNASGVLSYCVKQKVLSGIGPTSVLRQLTGRPGVKESNDFAIGQGGTLQADNMTLSVANLKGKVKTKMCDLVLKHAQSLL